MYAGLFGETLAIFPGPDDIGIRFTYLLGYIHIHEVKFSDLQSCLV